MAAYQLNFDDNRCFRLHNGITDPQWSLIDEHEPATGVQITYLNGDWCDAGQVMWFLFFNLYFFSFFIHVCVILIR